MYYFIIAVVFFIAGVVTGALVWRKNAKRFESLAGKLR